MGSQGVATFRASKVHVRSTCTWTWIGDDGHGGGFDVWRQSEPNRTDQGKETKWEQCKVRDPGTASAGLEGAEVVRAGADRARLLLTALCRFPFQKPERRRSGRQQPAAATTGAQDGIVLSWNATSISACRWGSGSCRCKEQITGENSSAESMGPHARLDWQGWEGLAGIGAPPLDVLFLNHSLSIGT